MQPTAYLSAEIGFSPDIPTYSGGLGILAGDHIKAAADAGLPLVAVTLLYREGYFVQHLDADGTQTHGYPRFTPEPLLQRLDETVTIALEGRDIRLALWRTGWRGHGGTEVPILLLDSDVADNSPEDRNITARLYGGDQRLRLRQEAVLGFGGLLAVQKLFGNTRRYHLNEGHCAFLPLALLRRGMSPEDVRRACHFTTHTPVPAGHDVFDYELAAQILGPLIKNLPTSIGELAGKDALSMSHLALATCGTANGVSELHGRVSREMFPGHDIGHITNGVHHLTWINDPVARLLDEHTAGWRENPAVLSEAAANIPDAALIAAHRACKRQLLTYANAASQRGYAEDLLTIGFARRAAPYKRASLLLSDPRRLAHICADKVQFIFAGKAHPRNVPGQEVIRQIVRAGDELAGRVRVCYLPNYTMATGRMITSGVDVWLNTPRRPHEASGTSGMKAALNGVPNASTADGWWPEGARHGHNGWVIGDPNNSDDAADAESLYRILEEEILSAYADRARWAALMKAAIATGARFTAARMVGEYVERYY